MTSDICCEVSILTHRDEEGLSQAFLHERRVINMGQTVDSFKTTAKWDLNRCNMYKRISYINRLKYALIAVALIFAGFLIMMTFFLMFTIPFALAVWAWSGIFVYLAVVGRSYSDFVSELRWKEGDRK